MTTGSAKYLSLVIPSYKSADALAKNLPYLLKNIASTEWDTEVIIVDDGSDDEAATERIVSGLRCKYIRLPENKGKGAALRAGVAQAKGSFIVFTDADIPYEWDALQRIVHYLDFKEFDMAAGDRTLPESRYFDELGTARHFGSRFFSFVVGRFVAGGMYDTQCGLKGFRAEAAKDLFGSSRLNGFAIDAELYYIALKRNYDIKKLPVKLRSQDGSSVSMVRHGFLMLFDLPKVIWNYYTGKYSQRS